MNSPELAIRSAEVRDAAPIAAIYAPYVPETAVSFETEPPTTQVMAERIGDTLRTHPWLVATRGDDIMGYAYAGKHRTRAAYRWSADVTVYVDRSMRRNGVGRALYRVLLETLRRQGFRSAFAEIVMPNPGSRRLHEATGFEQIGLYKDVGFKLGCWRDIEYWRLSLADGAAPPSELIPFAEFRETSTFTDVLRHGG